MCSSEHIYVVCLLTLCLSSDMTSCANSIMSFSYFYNLEDFLSTLVKSTLFFILIFLFSVCCQKLHLCVSLDIQTSVDGA